MNFFGHAAMARLVDDDPPFLLGAMAPDLLGMCGAEAGPATCPQVAAGQAHHLATDAAFHGSPAFLRLVSWSVQTLIARGMRRGPARGAAHVGVELLLDGALAADRQARAAYQRSLTSAACAPPPFLWRTESAADRWQTLIRRLCSGRVPEGYRDPDFVADRLVGALSRRPRLALAADDTATLRAFLPSLQQRVIAETPALIPSA